MRGTASNPGPSNFAKTYSWEWACPGPQLPIRPLALLFDGVHVVRDAR